MAKNDILDRLSNQPKAPVTVKRSADPGEKDKAKTQSTRVGKRVIRRRRKREDVAEAAPPSGLPSFGNEASEESAAEVAPATEVSSQKTQPGETPAVEAAEAGAPEESPVEQAESPTADAEVPVTEPAPESEAPAQAADAPAQQAPAEEASAEETAAAVAKPESTSPEAKEAATAADTSARSEKKKSASDGLKSLPGLGSAVIKPPPGYDPNNPQAAPKEEATTGPRWKDKKAAGADRGKPGTPDSEEGKRGKPRQKRRGRRQAFMDDYRMMPTRRKRNRRSGPKVASPQPKAQKRKIQVDGTISVGELAHQLGLKTPLVIKSLMGLGMEATINEQLEFEIVQMVAQEFEYEAVQVGFQEDEHLIELEVDESSLLSRPPVVTVMGHVDHGKTTLLDSIRQAKVADGEAGGITQHIGAYQVERGGQLISFIDTPGHEAFTSMRARGAMATDLVILVVAADDGVMPQTVESINHARAAGVQIIVAVNKCDKAGVNPDNIRQRLMEHELVPEEYGGETLMVNVSALEGQGIDELLDAVLLVAELQDFKADPARHAEGVVLEASLETGRGAVATVLVQQGTLRAGDSVVLGSVAGRVRAMSNHAGEKVKEAMPSTPVEIIGLEGVPVAGDDFVVVKNDKAARTLAGHRAGEDRKKGLVHRDKVTLEDLFAKSAEGEVVALNLVVKADVQGSVEALKSSLESIEVEGAEIKVLHSGVGGIRESDVSLAAAYSAIVLGFNVRPDSKARNGAEKEGVDIRTYRVIYEALDEVRAAAVGLLQPTFEEKHEASVEIRKTFSVPKIGTVAGCMVIEGKVVRGHQARLVRDGVVVWEGSLSSLRRFKDDVREVEKGYECGLGLENFSDIKEGDTLETYTMKEVVRTG